jgi:hypothetical protein
MTVKQWETQAQASLDIAFQIEANFGSNPDALDDLRFQVLPCPDNRTGKTLTCIAAFPRKEGATSDKLMVAIYG